MAHAYDGAHQLKNLKVKENAWIGALYLDSGDTNAAGTRAALDHYEELTHSSTITNGATIYTPASIKLVRVGNLVTMNIAACTPATATANTHVFTTVLPARMRPSVQVQANVMILENTLAINGIIEITTAGVVTIGEVIPGTATTTTPGAVSATTGSAPTGTSGLTVSWICN